MGQQDTILRKILVVDDDEILCLLYKVELEDEGYEVLVASKARQALEIVKNEPPDLVVMDIKMPGMDGIEALKRIVDKDPKIPVIINSAYPQFKEHFMSWAAEEYVVKSSDLRELKDKISNIMSRCEIQPPNNRPAWAFG